MTFHISELDFTQHAQAILPNVQYAILGDVDGDAVPDDGPAGHAVAPGPAPLPPPRGGAAHSVAAAEEERPEVEVAAEKERLHEVLREGVATVAIVGVAERPVSTMALKPGSEFLEANSSAATTTSKVVSAAPSRNSASRRRSLVHLTPRTVLPEMKP
jgi:hypothetical protein